MNGEVLFRELEALERSMDSLDAQLVGLADEQRKAALEVLRRSLCAKLHRVQGRLFNHLRHRRRYR